MRRCGGGPPCRARGPFTAVLEAGIFRSDGDSDPTALLDGAQAYKGFFDAHIAPWVGAFAVAVACETELCFYRATAGLLELFVRASRDRDGV